MPWWSPLIGVLVGALLGYGIAALRDLRRRNRERAGHFEALALETRICGELAEGFAGANVKAPSYRMPLLAYDRSLTALLADGVLHVDEIGALFRFVVSARAFNYAVDQAQTALFKDDKERREKLFEREVRRARIKAAKLRANGGTLHAEAARVLHARLSDAARARLKAQPPVAGETEAEE